MGNNNCEARQYSDQMICTKCGLVWDTNDPDPPKCKVVTTKPESARDKALRQIKEVLK